MDHVQQVLKSFPCNKCELAFETRCHLKMHSLKIHETVAWKTKLLGMETQVSGLRFQISSKLFRMQELEHKKKQSCRCKGVCIINHSKHNWTKSSSNGIVCRMMSLNIGVTDGVKMDMHECVMCEHKFHKVDEFVMHIQNNHKAADVQFLQ